MPKELRYINFHKFHNFKQLYRTFNVKYTPEFAAKIRNDYKIKGLEISEILNEAYA